MQNFIKNLKYDIPAGMVVFLVALPLCLGIAQASESPPFSGIIAGVVGGVVVTILSKSKYGVSGPAAGLTTIVLAAIGKLGFEAFLLSLVIAGVLQFLFGQFRLGFLGYFIPVSVIKGMLASIGLILILKQFPHVLGMDTDYIGDFVFKQSQGDNTFNAITKAWRFREAGAIIISLVSILVMVVWDLPKVKKLGFFNLIPSSLFVVVLGIFMNEAFVSYFPSLAIDPYTHMVDLPTALITYDYSTLLVFPDFMSYKNPDVWITALTIAIVASIETLLSVEATDNLDPDKNLTPTNAELKAQGVGNLLSGLIGGIPVTQVIVRSSANINANAKSKYSSLFHGIFLGVAVMLFPKYIQMIPLASLAAILLVLGYKLTSIKKAIIVWKQGRTQFIPFVITIAGVLFTDLLTGIAIGLGVSMITILRSNYETAYTVNEAKDRIIVSFAFVVSFLNKGSIMEDLYKIPENSRVVISAKKCHFISHDIIELLNSFIHVVAVNKNIKVELIGFDRYGLYVDEPSEEDEKTVSETSSVSQNS